MVTSKIERATAKDELSRINDYLTSPYLLIGGLAVQQYEISRNSRDIDLICDFETIQAILENLYPTMEWETEDRTDDDYRPAYHIKHRDGRPDEIVFGPKVAQRGDYPFLKWSELEKKAKPFRLLKKELSNILVPTPHALAYSKAVSFAARKDEHTSKVAQDAQDLANLTNHSEFLLSEFWNFFKRNDPHGILAESFRSRASKFQGQLAKSCIHSLSTLFQGTAAMSTSKKPTYDSRVSVYLAAPHKNTSKNGGVAQALRQVDISVKVPLEEVERAGITESIDNAKQIRAVCIKAIDDSDTVIVDLDSYGLDTAWELGYAEGKGKRVIGYNLDIQKSTDPQPINRRHYSQNFMHGWGDTLVYEDPSALVPFCTGKTVYVCGSFSNAEIARLAKSDLERAARKLIIPSKHVSASAALPREYPLRDRESTNRLLAAADVVLVILPRYGMDAAWQIGYAAALGKPLIGLIRRDDKREVVNQSFWDHWMHGWKQKPHLTSLRDLVAFVKVQDDVVKV